MSRTSKRMADKKKTSSGGSSRGSENQEQQVDDLLRIVEDEMFLHMKINTHTSNTTTTGTRCSPLHSDLTRRFDALKSPNISIDNDSISAPPKTTPAEGEEEVDRELLAILGPDLSARFSALKFNEKNNPSVTTSNPSVTTSTAIMDDGDDDDDVDADGISKREVDKLIEWAKDAARLDPSLTDDDIDSDGDDSDDQDEEKDKAKRAESTRK